MINIFISYAREDKIVAEKLFTKLKLIPFINPWIDFNNLLPSQNWKSAIKSAIKKSDLFIAVLSKNSVNKRGFVQKEIKDALEVLDEFPENQIYFIPTRSEKCEIPYQKIKDLHYFDLFPDIDHKLTKLLSILSNLPNFKDMLLQTDSLIKYIDNSDDKLLKSKVENIAKSIKSFKHQLISSFLPLLIDIQGMSEVYNTGDKEKLICYFEEVIKEWTEINFPIQFKALLDKFDSINDKL